MVISPKNKIRLPNFIEIDDHKVTFVTDFKLLGITIDDRLTFANLATTTIPPPTVHNTAGVCSVMEGNHLTQVHVAPGTASLIGREADRLMRELRVAHEQRDEDQKMINRTQTVVNEAYKATKLATSERCAAVKAQRNLEETVKNLVAYQESVTDELCQQRRAIASQIAFEEYGEVASRPIQ